MNSDKVPPRGRARGYESAFHPARVCAHADGGRADVEAFGVASLRHDPGLGGGVPLLFHRPVSNEATASWLQRARLVATPIPRGQMMGLGGTF